MGWANNRHIFTRIGTYVQRGSKFCLVVLIGVTVIAQNIALLSNFTMHSAALLGSLAQQPCIAALPKNSSNLSIFRVSTNFNHRRYDFFKKINKKFKFINLKKSSLK
jgi:hypothetical protein